MVELRRGVGSASASRRLMDGERDRAGRGNEVSSVVNRNFFTNRKKRALWIGVVF